MTITVAAGVVARIRREPEAIVLQVQQPSDPEAAATALARAADDIAGLAGGTAPGLAPGERIYPKWVSEVMRAGTGPFLMIDAVDTPRRLLGAIPDAVVARLEEAGVSEATVACPRQGGPLTRMFYGGGTGLPRSVMLMLFPRPPGRVPPDYRADIRDSWLAEGAAWVTEGVGHNGGLRARIVATEFSVEAGEAEAMLRQAVTGGNQLELVSGTVPGPIRRTYIDARSFLARSSFSGGGPAVADAELADTAEALVGVARRLAPEVAYGAVTVEPTFGTGSVICTDWYLNHGGEDPQRSERLCDEYVIDAFAYQVLGPLHVARLGGPPPGAESLDGDRVGLAVGQPTDWLLDPPESRFDPYVNLCARRRDPTVQERGRHLLAPCLLRTGEGPPLLESRQRHDPRS